MQWNAALLSRGFEGLHAQVFYASSQVRLLAASSSLSIFSLLLHRCLLLEASLAFLCSVLNYLLLLSF